MPPTPAAWVIFALALVWTALFFRLGSLPLIQPDEGRNAEVAREMMESGAWLSPTYNGIAYLDKPAFYFKAVALSLACFGNHEAAARFPSALFALALLALVYFFCRRVHDARCGILAMIVVGTMPLFMVNARTVIFDMALAFFVSAAIFSGYLAETCAGQSRRNWYLAGALAAGLATLVKGPVGFLIPGLVLVVFNWFEGRRGILKRLFAPLNLLVFFGVTLPWFIGLSWQHPDFPYYGIVEESFHRFTTVKFHRTQPIYFYAVIVIGLFLPWSFLLPEAGVAAWKNKWFKSPADRLCLVWAVVVIIFFSLSKSKTPGYILSTTVACGILVARFFQQAMANPGGKAARIAGRGAVILAGVCLVAAAVAIFMSSHIDLVAQPMGLSLEAATLMAAHFTTPIILLLVFASVGLLARYLRDAGLGFMVFAIFPVLLFTLDLDGIEVVFNVKSARQMVRAIPELPPGTEVTLLRCLPGGLTFYLNHTATLVSQDLNELTSNYILFHLKDQTNWPPNLVPDASLKPWLATRTHPVFLVARANARTELEGLAGLQKTNILQLSPLYLGVLLPPH